jgi:hypothetical protein
MGIYVRIGNYLFISWEINCSAQFLLWLRMKCFTHSSITNLQHASYTCTHFILIR